MSQNNPIRVFVTHSWEVSDDYLRVFEYLESARNCQIWPGRLAKKRSASRFAAKWLRQRLWSGSPICTGSTAS